MAITGEISHSDGEAVSAPRPGLAKTTTRHRSTSPKLNELHEWAANLNRRNTLTVHDLALEPQLWLVLD